MMSRVSSAKQRTVPSRGMAVMEKKKSSNAVLCLIVAAASFLVYFNAMDGQFVYDDKLLLEQDPDSYSFSRLPGHFTGEEGFHETMGRYYRPLTAVTYGVDKLVGEIVSDELDPRVFHFTNMVIHATAGILLFLFLHLLFGNRIAALAGALLFAVHPVHTEAVTWISGRTDSLCCLFYLAALLAHLRFRRRGGTPGDAVRIVVFFAAALLCKEMAVTFPVAVVLFDLTLGRQGAGLPAEASSDGPGSGPSRKSRFVVYAVLFGTALLYMALREWALRHVADRETLFYFYGDDRITAAATMLQTVPVYVRLLFVPVNLLYNYNGTIPYQAFSLDLSALAASAVVIVTLGAAFFLRRKRPAVTFCILFFYLALMPVMNIVPTMTLMAERFLYLPSVVAGILAADILAGPMKRKTRSALLGLVAAVVLIFGWMTVERNPDWYDNETLYLSAEGTSGIDINVNLGNHRAREADRETANARYERARALFDRAEALYREAISIKHDTPKAWLNLGVLFLRKGEPLAALEYIGKACDLDPLSPDPPHALAWATQRLAELRSSAARAADERGDTIQAVALRREERAFREAQESHLREALGRDPLSPIVLYELGLLSYRMGRIKESIDILEKLQEIEPGFNGSDIVLEKIKEERDR